MNTQVDPFDEITKKAIADMRLLFEEHSNRILAMFDKYEEKIMNAFEPLVEDAKQRQIERMLE